jgi:hypothetical protein
MQGGSKSVMCALWYHHALLDQPSTTQRMLGRRGNPSHHSPSSGLSFIVLSCALAKGWPPSSSMQETVISLTSPMYHNRRCSHSQSFPDPSSCLQQAVKQTFPAAVCSRAGEAPSSLTSVASCISSPAAIILPKHQKGKETTANPQRYANLAPV